LKHGAEYKSWQSEVMAPALLPLVPKGSKRRSFTWRSCALNPKIQNGWLSAFKHEDQPQDNGDKMEYQIFCKCWDRLCIAHGEPINTDRRHSYYLQLGEYSDDHLFVAFECCLRELKWFPKISEVLDRIPQRRNKAEDWEDWEPAKPLTQKYDCSKWTDDEIMERLMPFVGATWDDQQQKYMLNRVRSNVQWICQTVCEAMA
jgi:hypothetical protein